MTLIDTAKAADANSYCSDAFAQAYFDARLNATAWSGAGDKQETALLMACARMEQEKYKGTRTTTAQALKFPRIGLVDDDGLAVDPDVVPLVVKQAQCEYALDLLIGDTTRGTGLEQFKSLAVSSIRLDMRDPITSQSNNPNLYPAVPGDPATTLAVNRAQMPMQVQRLLRMWLITDVPQGAQSGWGTVRLSKS
jgi:hypothetical protein